MSDHHPPVTYHKVQFKYSRDSDWRDCTNDRLVLSQAQYKIGEYRRQNQPDIKFKIVKVTEEDVEE